MGISESKYDIDCRERDRILGSSIRKLRAEKKLETRWNRVRGYATSDYPYCILDL